MKTLIVAIAAFACLFAVFGILAAFNHELDSNKWPMPVKIIFWGSSIFIGWKAAKCVPFKKKSK